MSSESPGRLKNIENRSARGFFAGRLRFSRTAVSLFVSLLLGAFLIVYLSAGKIYHYSDTMDQSHLPTVDAIVCLGGGVGRIKTSGKIWLWYKREDQAGPTLYFSGMGPKSTWEIVARQLDADVIQRLPREKILVENESENTLQNALWFARAAKKHNWKRVLLVTSPYHMKRAEYLFQSVLEVEDLPVQIDLFSVKRRKFAAGHWRSSLNGTYVTMTEYVKWLYYRYIWRYLWSPDKDLSQQG